MFVYALDNTIVADIIPVSMFISMILPKAVAQSIQAIINAFNGADNLPWLSVG